MKQLWFALINSLRPKTSETDQDRAWYWVNRLRHIADHELSEWSRSNMRYYEIETRFVHVSHFLLYLNRLKLAMSQTSPIQSPPQSYQEPVLVTLDEYFTDSDDYPLDLGRTVEQIRDVIEDILILFKEAPESVTTAYTPKVELIQVEWLHLCTTLFDF